MDWTCADVFSGAPRPTWQQLSRKVHGTGTSPAASCNQTIERTLAWISKCRALLVRYEKKAANYLGLITVAAILLWYRRWWRTQRTG
jgi:transposase